MSKKETNKTATPNQGIGFGKGARVGNFRLYKIRKGVGSKETVEALVVSSLNQSWSVTIPCTLPVYHLIEDAYASSIKDDSRMLNMLLGNFLNATLTPRADYHYLVNCIAQIFADPNGEVEKDGKKYKLYDAVANDVRWIGERIATEYEQDRLNEEQNPDEEALKLDETFHDMVNELQKLEKKEANDGAKSE
nr:MAG TPA: hypothetical protein [Caudoviricetes sp.]